MKFKLIIFLVVLSFLSFSCGTKKILSSFEFRDEVGNYYIKKVDFPVSATIEEKVEMASRVIPTTNQYNWQSLELTAFIHFGINTFTGKEWGDGTESPSEFYPTDLDVDQWVRVLKDAGFKLIILTAKHHDGFCLWPTKTTSHSVASSPYKGGKGDIVKEFSDACKKYGVKMGLYLSPWDRNASSYGQGEAYNDFYVEQLTELVTGYGELTELWLDGAKGEGANQDYDIERWLEVLKKYQPNAVSAVMGEDVRWVGNEQGYGRETEWGVQGYKPNSYKDSESYNSSLGLVLTGKDLGSRDILKKVNSVYWYPSEVDVSIRPGWFYHDYETPKSLDKLIDIYYKSVGYNSVLLLNVPPDKRGQFDSKDIAVLGEFGNYIKTTFTTGLLKNVTNTWVNAKIGASKEYSLKTPSAINVLLIQENIMKGQRVEKFSVEVYSSGQWNKITVNSKEPNLTTIGYKRLVKFDTVQNAEKIRITLEEARTNANISQVNVYYSAK
ncbi:alpha-L-fucosidase [Brachyspira pilosicoli]|uniref:alpha-L-fucosidase n=1 Tax=Brachyspira pilosicoli TaxID=52584 RepID=UPI003005BA13